MDKYQHDIEEYLADRMSYTESTLFKYRLSKDPEMQKALDQEAMARQLITDGGRLELIERFKSFEAETEETNKSSRFMPLWIKRALPIAAMFIIFFGVYQYLTFSNSLSGEAVYVEYFEPYEAPSVMRDVEKKDSFDWKTATKFYRSGGYENAHFYFLKPNTEIPNYLVEFYRGVSAMSMQNPNDEVALKHLEMVLINDNDFVEQANWYKALVLLRSGDNEKSREAFQEIVNRKDFNYEKAMEVLKLNIRD